MTIPTHDHSIDRGYCPRPDCRAEWGDAWRTIEIAQNGRSTALCGATHPDGWQGIPVELHIAERQRKARKR